MSTTTIQLDKETVDEMKSIREYPRQTYNELLKKMIKMFKAAKDNNQYDRFLYSVQQAKMKELWDNNDDEAWNDV